MLEVFRSQTSGYTRSGDLEYFAILISQLPVIRSIFFLGLPPMNIWGLCEIRCLGTKYAICALYLQHALNIFTPGKKRERKIWEVT